MGGFRGVVLGGSGRVPGQPGQVGCRVGGVGSGAGSVFDQRPGAGSVFDPQKSHPSRLETPCKGGQKMEFLGGFCAKIIKKVIFSENQK